MDDLTIARAFHVLAIVHWIGGVSMVTLVILPALMRSVPAHERIALFDRIEGRFAFQARLSTLVAGASGFWMLHRLAAWDRLLSIRFWWIHAMIAVWLLFTLVLFVGEPLFLHRWFHERAAREPEATVRLVLRLHVLLLTVSAITVAAGVLGAHGAFY